MKRRLLLAALAAPAVLAACHRRRPPPPPAAAHYVLGPPYEAGGVWRYPTARTEGEETGIAAILPRTAKTTVTGERYDPEKLTAAHPTLQLPCAVRVTVLETGRSVVLRVNDRGPADPARALAVSPRAAALLGFSDATAVRVTILPAETASLADATGAPSLALAPMPRGEVTSRPLDQSGPAVVTGGGAAPLAAASVILPETVDMRPPEPVSLGIALATFTHEGAARTQLARSGEPGRIAVARTGRSAEYAVRLGPYATIPDADAALRRVLRAGVPDARIVAQTGAEEGS